MNSNTTLKKISQALNISISTVSRALKNHPDISERTKQKVCDLAQTLEYEPNANAVSLRTNNSKLFGLIVPTVSNYFYESLIASIEEECRGNGYSVLILQSGDDPAIEINNLKICRQNRITGLFACITPHTKDIQNFLKLKEVNIPLIFFDKVPDIEKCNKVCMSDSLAAELAANFLIKKNKKKIFALFGDINLSITRKRSTAFNDVFNKNNLKIKLMIDYAHSAEEARTKTFNELKKPSKPDAIFCMSDEILTGVMKAIQELNLKIPSDISVLAISNGLVPKLYFPEITYVETSGYKLGKLAFTCMAACLSNNSVTQELFVEAVLVEGGSV